MFERNDRFFNDGEVKSDLKDIPWDNILSLDDISGSLPFFFFGKSKCTVRWNKLSKPEISLKAKPWINKNTQSLKRESVRLFKCYCNKNNPTLKVAKHKNIKMLKT